jgi:hypothetical protein
LLSLVRVKKSFGLAGHSMGGLGNAHLGRGGPQC